MITSKSHTQACHAHVSCLVSAGLGILGDRNVFRGWVAPSVWAVYVCVRVTVCLCMHKCVGVWVWMGSALTTLCCLHYISMPDRKGEKRVRGRVRDTVRERRERANSLWKCWIETLQGFFRSINSAQLFLNDLPFSSVGFCLFLFGWGGGWYVSWPKEGYTHTGGFTLLAIAQRFDASLSPVRRHAVLLPQGTLIYRHANLGQNVSSWKGQICIEKERSRGRQDRRG